MIKTIRIRLINESVRLNLIFLSRTTIQDMCYSAIRTEAESYHSKFHIPISKFLIPDCEINEWACGLEFRLNIMAEGIPLSVEFSPNVLTRDELVVYYSLMNYSCKDIQQLLQYVHGHVIRYFM